MDVENKPKFISDVPELLAEYDISNSISPDKMYLRTNKLAIWKCKTCGKTFKRKVSNRYIKQSTGEFKISECPNCSINKKIYISDIKELAEEYDIEKNWLLPNEVSVGSCKLVFWRCKEHKHSFLESPHARLRREKDTHQITKCPVCFKKDEKDKKITSVLDMDKRFNDGIVYSKNNIIPGQLLNCSDERNIVEWMCEKCGYKWKNTPASRYRKKYCTMCKRTKAGFVKREESLGALFPNVLKHWDYDKNKTTYIDPFHIAPNSSRKAYFICENGHTVLMEIRKRIKNQYCPKCFSKKTGISFPEKAVFYYLKKGLPNFKIEPNYKINSGTKAIFLEYDIYIPELNIAIEYDGVYYHKDKQEIDKNKNDIALKNNTSLYRIREPGLLSISNCKEYILASKDTRQDMRGLVNVINEILQDICFNNNLKYNAVEVNESDTCKIEMLGLNKIAGHLFAEECPELLKYWDYERNLVSPFSFLSNSHQKIHLVNELGVHRIREVSRLVKRYKATGKVNFIDVGRGVIAGETDLGTALDRIGLSYRRTFTFEDLSTIGKTSEKQILITCPICGASKLIYARVLVEKQKICTAACEHELQTKKKLKGKPKSSSIAA